MRGATEGNSYNTVGEWERLSFLLNLSELGTKEEPLYIIRLSYSVSKVFRVRPKFLCSFRN